MNNFIPNDRTTVIIPWWMDTRNIPKNFMVIDRTTTITPPVNMVLIDKSYYEHLSKDADGK